MKKQDFPRPNTTLGGYIRVRREALRLTVPDVVARSGLHHSYWNRLENGHYAEPGPKYLRIIADTLGLDVADLYALAGYDTPERLPAFTPYLRARYDLPPEAVAELERYFTMLRAYYEIPDDQPVFPPKPGDEQPDQRAA